MVLLPHPLNECGVTGWMFACLKMGACLFVAELAATALAAGWLGTNGLGVAAAGYSSRLRAGRDTCGLFMAPVGWGLSPDGARGWVARRKRVGGWVQAEQAAASPTRTDVKGKAIQHRGGSRSGRGRKSASLLKICGSSKA